MEAARAVAGEGALGADSNSLPQCRVPLRAGEGPVSHSCPSSAARQEALPAAPGLSLCCPHPSRSQKMAKAKAKGGSRSHWESTQPAPLCHPVAAAVL